MPYKTNRPIYHFAWITAFCLYFTWMMTHRLDTFPGLHGDEAWFGLDAIRMMSVGATSLYGIEWYVGSLYSLSLASIFSRFGVDVFTLRILTVSANVVATGLMATVLLTFFGPRSAYIALCLLGSSLYFLWFSRVAWEVWTFNFLFLVIILSIIIILFRFKSEITKVKWHLLSLLLLCVSWLGCFNHLVFACVPLTLVVASVLYAVFEPTPFNLRLVNLTIFGCALPLLVLSKLFIQEYFVGKDAKLGAVLFYSIPVIWELIYWCTESALFRITRKIIEQINVLFTWIITRRWLSSPQRKKWGGRLLIIAIVSPFIADHGRAFGGIVSNMAVMQRIVSLQPSIIIRLLGWLFGALVIVPSVYAIMTAWQTFRARIVGAEKYGFLVIWLIVSLPLSPAMILRANSLRYYWLSFFLLVIVGAACSSCITKNIKPVWMVTLLLPVSVFGYVSFSESERTAPRPPIQFSLGLMKETSTEFLPITPLATKLHADNCCILKDTSYFIEQPIYFLFASNKWPCDGDMRCQAEYCRLCEENGFFLSKVRRHEKNNQKSLH